MHGSAPKYAGKVNPIAMLLTTKLMLDWLKEADMATRLESAIARVIKEGKVRTYDMMRLPGSAKAIAQGAATTVQMTDAVIGKLAADRELVFAGTEREFA
jgi:isocitrate dehydrogenase (NAD+)